jgi:hypothetical protein
MRIADKEISSASGTGKSATLDPTLNSSVKERLAKILSMIWYDVDDGFIMEGNAYSSADLQRMEQLGVATNVYNNKNFEAQPDFASTDIALNGWNNEMKAYSFVYKSSNKGDTTNIFKKGATARFFNKIVYPSDYSNADVKTIGDFYIIVWVQAIQTEGFDNREVAIAELSNEDVDNDLTHVDGQGMSS